MQALANSSGSLIALGMRDGLSMLYIETCRSQSFVTLNLNVGSRIPIATTAMGRACLAAMNPGTRKTVEDRIRTADPGGWPRIEAGIHHAIAELEESGCCTSFGDWRREVQGIATPLRVGKGMPLMILSASGPSQTMPATLFMSDIRRQLLATAAGIERHFKTRPD